MNEFAIVARDIRKSFPLHKYHKNLQQTLVRWRDRSIHLRNQVLNDISFEIRVGEKVALVGRNGSGKTTLLRLLAGIYAPDGGVLDLYESPCMLFDANVGTNQLLSVIDNVFLFAAVHEIDRALVEPHLDQILQMAGLEQARYTPFRDLSKGQRQRFALSIFLQTRADLILFDEALTNLDIGFLLECDRYFAALKASPKTVLMTSHDAHFLRRHCERALWLDGGHMRMDGEVNTVIDAYEQSF